MGGTAARVARVFLAAGSIGLVCAGAATAATFKSDSGKLAAAKKTGVTASGGALKFAGTANPTGSTNFAGQIDFTSGKATGLKAPGKLTLKHSGHTATLKVKKISGTTLTAKLGTKSLTFPLSFTNATSTPNSTGTKWTGVSVKGVVVKLSSTDATALKNALKTSVYKSGAKFGTLSYNGIDRELIETTGGTNTLCNDQAFLAKTIGNGITPSAISPATAFQTGCTGAKDQGSGITFPENGKPLGFLDTATGSGRITLEGGIQDQRSTTTGQFKSPILDLLGTNSDLRATVFANGLSLGQQTLATVTLTAAPVLHTTKSGGTFSVPADGTTVALNQTGANDLNGAFCTPASSCPAGTYSAGEAIGYSGGQTSFK